MARDAPDYVLHIDRDGNGGVKRTLVYQEEHPVDTASWSSQRAAAATSLASWLSWLSTNDQTGHAWVTSFSSADQEGLRQALLLGG